MQFSVYLEPSWMGMEGIYLYASMRELYSYASPDEKPTRPCEAYALGAKRHVPLVGNRRLAFA